VTVLPEERRSNNSAGRPSDRLRNRSGHRGKKKLNFHGRPNGRDTAFRGEDLSLFLDEEDGNNIVGVRIVGPRRERNSSVREVAKKRIGRGSGERRRAVVRSLVQKETWGKNMNASIHGNAVHPSREPKLLKAVEKEEEWGENSPGNKRNR